MLLEINHPSNGKAFSNVQELGVVIRVTGPCQRHVGLLLNLGIEGVRLCHLASHKDLRSDEPRAGDAWLQSGLDEDERRAVAFFVDGIIRVNRPEGIPYSPGLEGHYFDLVTYRYVRNATSEGLTCATFIMAIFETLRLPLLMRETWQMRAADEVWQREIIDVIEYCCRKKPGIEEHVASLRDIPSSSRFRPEEVAAAVGSTDAPLNFEVASARGRTIVESILIPVPSGPSASG